MTSPLAGVRVLDLSRLLPGPYATLVLADLGADVVKVEDPEGGDYLRWMPPLAGEQSGYFYALNRNKRSLCLDLEIDAGRAVLLRLARSFDAVVESFRPGVMEKLGLGYGALRDANPRIILCSISGYGQEGPYRDRAGHDLNYCAIAGVLALNGPAERPFPLGVQVADVAGGSWPAVTGILAALYRREVTGEGAHVDIAMAEGALGLLAMPLGAAAARGSPLQRGRELLTGGLPQYGVFRTKDGRFVALGALEPKFFARFCEAVGRPELGGAPPHPGPLPQGEGNGPRSLRDALAAIFASRTRDEWSAFGAHHDVCLTPVLEGDEPMRDPQLRHRGAFVEIETPWEGKALPGLATPVRIAGAPAPLRPAPPLGADGPDVLRESGFSEQEIAELKARGIL